MRISTHRLTRASIMAALCCALTMFGKLPVPITYGYVHLGDAAVLLCAFIPGGKLGILAGAVGSALADILGGYTQYALATLIIKAIMVTIVCLMTHKKSASGIISLFSMILAELFMIVSYFCFDLLMYGTQLLEKGFWLNLSGSITQALFGILTGYILIVIISKNNLLKK